MKSVVNDFHEFHTVVNIGVLDISLKYLNLMGHVLYQDSNWRVRKSLETYKVNSWSRSFILEVHLGTTTYRGVSWVVGSVSQKKRGIRGKEEKILSHFFHRIEKERRKE